MNCDGEIRRMNELDELSEKERQEFFQINDEHQAQAGMLLRGDKKCRVDPKVFKTWTRKSRKRMQKLSRRTNR
jgi:hypothetical protein